MVTIQASVMEMKAGVLKQTFENVCTSMGCLLMWSSIGHCLSACLNMKTAQFFLRPVARCVVKVSNAKLAFLNTFCDLS